VLQQVPSVVRETQNLRHVLGPFTHHRPGPVLPDQGGQRCQ
jgi:hypothetical protein